MHPSEDLVKHAFTLSKPAIAAMSKRNDLRELNFLNIWFKWTSVVGIMSIWDDFTIYLVPEAGM